MPTDTRQATRYHDSGDRHRGAVATVASTPRYANPDAYQYHDPSRRDSTREREPPNARPVYTTSRHSSRQAVDARPQIDRRESRDQDGRYQDLNEASEEDDDVVDDLQYSRSPPARGPRHEHEAEFGRLSRQGTKDSGYSSKSDKSAKAVQQGSSQARHAGGNNPVASPYSTSPAQARDLAYRPGQPAPKPVYRSERRDSFAEKPTSSAKQRPPLDASDRSRHSKDGEYNPKAHDTRKQKVRARDPYGDDRAESTTQKAAMYDQSRSLKPGHGTEKDDRHSQQPARRADARTGYAPNSSRPRHGNASRSDERHREDRDMSPPFEEYAERPRQRNIPLGYESPEDGSDDGFDGTYGLSPRTSQVVQLPQERHVNFAEPKDRQSVSSQLPDSRDAYVDTTAARRHRPRDDDGFDGSYGLRSERLEPESRYAPREPSYRPRRY